MTDLERLMAYVEIAGECHEWTGYRNWLGYGTTHFDGRNMNAHRAVWLASGRDIPEGFVLDHLCGNRACVRLDHLEPVTQRENLMRSPLTQASINAAKTHCKRGHEFTPENTYIYQPGDRRACATCVKAAQRARIAAMKPQERVA